VLKVYSIIVCYNPEVAALLLLCRKLIYDCSLVLIIDNTESSYISRYINLPECTVISLHKNTGIAYAQNIGIKNAIKNHADVIVFFDQDSMIENNFLKFLLAPLKAGELGVVAPVLFDNDQGYEFPAMRLNRFGFPVKIYNRHRTLPYDVDLITSSGSAATAATFDIIGLMDEDLFIDFVETEWCLRCRKKNISIQVVPAAVMRHSIGEVSINFGFMRGFVHNPTRCYYQIRNCFLLFRKKRAPFLLAVKEISSVFVHNTILFLFAKDKIKYMRSYILAILHGLAGVTGKMPS